MEPNEKCGNCRYFCPSNADKDTGECHRHAPRPNPRPKMQIEGRDLWADTQWPKVAANTWCGDFEQKAT